MNLNSVGAPCWSQLSRPQLSVSLIEAQWMFHLPLSKSSLQMTDEARQQVLVTGKPPHKHKLSVKPAQSSVSVQCLFRSQKFHFGQFESICSLQFSRVAPSMCYFFYHCYLWHLLLTQTLNDFINFPLYSCKDRRTRCNQNCKGIRT